MAALSLGNCVPSRPAREFHGSSRSAGRPSRCRRTTAHQGAQGARSQDEDDYPPSTSEPSRDWDTDDLLARGMTRSQFKLAAGAVALPAFTGPDKEQLGKLLGAQIKGDNSPLGKAKLAVKQLQDRAFFEDTLPPIGSGRISYARFLQMLTQRQIKRLTVLGDGKCALVEVPIEQGGHDYDTQRYRKADLSELYVQELPEWRQEMLRFYVDLPGDWWYNSRLYELLRLHLPHKTGDGYRAIEWLTQDDQYVLEVRVKDPGDSFSWASQYAGSIQAIGYLFLLRGFLGAAEWIAISTGKLLPRQSDKEKLAEDMGKSIAKAYNVGKGGKGTGVKFDDVAGIDSVKGDIRDILRMLLGAKEFKEMGARVPRGILLEGPPGTGKTYLAKAMADEAGIPFYSANGAEFVQMFSGVAAARVRSLFKEARATAPSIVFIDEVDAIGKARVDGSGQDPGSSEREQGLLQLLVEMDGFSMDDQVLVVAATNRKEVLDKALLRPGRFDRAIYMGRPGPDNRYKILAVHARGKQIPRDDDDAFLKEVALQTTGFSGAALANLMNEAAILQVRYAKPAVDMDVIQRALAKLRVGLPSASLPLTKAKRHLASTLIGRACAMASTPGMPRVDSVSIKPYGTQQGRIIHPPQDLTAAGRDVTQLAYEPLQGKSSAEQGDFSFCVGLLMPLYMARATEEVLWGPDSATLATSQEIGIAGDLAHWLVLHSKTNPALFGVRTQWGQTDPMTCYQDPAVAETLALRLQTVAYHRALMFAHERRDLITLLTSEMIAAEDEAVPGKRVYSMLKDTPAQEVEQSVRDSLPFADLIPPEAAADFLVDEKNLLRAANYIKGDVDPGVMLSEGVIRREANVLRKERDEWFARRQEMERYATDPDATFPSKPEIADTVISV